MTLPRIPGLWDEIGPDVEKLAKTITRSVNPHFDNQLALAQMLREDPTKRQAMIDLEALNPGTLEQMYGKKVASNFTQGTPSVKASTEIAGRRNVGKRVDTITPTFENEAALAAAGVKNAQDRSVIDLSLRQGEQQLDYYEFKFDQEKWLAALENPEIKARFDMAAAARALPENANIALADPYEMAKQFLNGELDTNKITTLATISPAGYEMFKTAVQDIGQNARAARADARADARIQAEYDRADRTDLNAAKRQARIVSERTGLPYGELLKYYTLDESADPNVLKFFEDDQRVQERTALLSSLSKITPLAQAVIKAEGRDKDIAKSALEAGLYTLFNAPVRINEIPNDDSWVPWDKKVKYTLNTGDVVDGEMLYNLANDPDLYAEMEGDTRKVLALTPEQAKAELALIIGQQTAIQPQRYQRLYSLLQNRAGTSPATARSRRTQP